MFTFWSRAVRAVLRWATTMAKVLSISIITTAAKTAARLIVR